MPQNAASGHELTTTLALQANQMYTATVLVNSAQTRTVDVLGDSSDSLLPGGPFTGNAPAEGGLLVEANLGTQTFTTESSGKVTVSVSAQDQAGAIRRISVSGEFLTHIVVASGASGDNMVFDDVAVIINGPLP